mgnify:CR=1 FL=1
MKNLYRSKLLLVSVIALTVLLVALDSFMLRYSPKLFWITLPLLLLSGGIAAVSYTHLTLPTNSLV